MYLKVLGHRKRKNPPVTQVLQRKKLWKSGQKYRDTRKCRQKYGLTIKYVFVCVHSELREAVSSLLEEKKNFLCQIDDQQRRIEELIDKVSDFFVFLFLFKKKNKIFFFAPTMPNGNVWIFYTTHDDGSRRETRKMRRNFATPWSGTAKPSRASTEVRVRSLVYRLTGDQSIVCMCTIITGSLRPHHSVYNVLWQWLVTSKLFVTMCPEIDCRFLHCLSICSRTWTATSPLVTCNESWQIFYQLLFNMRLDTDSQLFYVCI